MDERKPGLRSFGRAELGKKGEKMQSPWKWREAHQPFRSRRGGGGAQDLGSQECILCSVAREMAHGEAAFRLNGEASFRDATVQALFLEEQPDQLRHIKLGADACSLKGELLRLFVQEAVSRAGNLAHLEGFDEIRSEHLEKILPQLLLDFA